MSEKQLTLFLDTNALLHYPAIKDVDWCKLCCAESVRLVLCLQVIKELDEKKNDARLGARAERVIKEVESLRAASIVRAGVTLEIFNCVPRSQDFPGTLSPDDSDDRIVHSVKKYIEERSENMIAVCSEDMGMSLRCEAHSIKVIKPNRSTKLDNPQNEQDRKHKALLAEFAELKARMPTLDLSVIAAAHDENRSLLRRAIRQPPHLDVEKEVEAERVKLQLPPLKRFGMVPAALTNPIDGISLIERHEYDLRLPSYLERFRTYLIELNHFNDSLGGFFEFRLELSNVGSTPAEEVEATIYFPPILSVITCQTEIRSGIMPDKPLKPTAPKRPRSASESMMASHRKVDHVLQSPKAELRDHPAFRLQGEAVTGFVIRLNVLRLLHFKSRIFGNFCARFRSKDDNHPFEAKLALTAGNLPRKIERPLRFLFDSELKIDGN